MIETTNILVIHGFSDRSGGDDNINKIKPLLEALGYKVDVDGARYGYMSLLAVRFRKHKTILRIAKAMADADVIITYSNGAHFCMKALKLVLRKSFIIIHASPALNRKIKFPENVKKCWVFHIRSDTTVWLASFIPWSKWGRMGAVGYKGDDPRVVNIDYTDIAKKHGGMWKDYVIGYFVEQVHELLERLHEGEME